MTWHLAFSTGQFRGCPKLPLMMEIYAAIEERRQLLCAYDSENECHIPQAPFPSPFQMPELMWYQHVYDWVFNPINNHQYTHFVHQVYSGTFNDVESFGRFKLGNAHVLNFYGSYNDPNFSHYEDEYTLNVIGLENFVTPEELRGGDRLKLYNFYLQIQRMLVNYNAIAIENLPNWPEGYIPRFGTPLYNQTLFFSERWVGSPPSISVDNTGHIAPASSMEIGSFSILPFCQYT